MEALDKFWVPLIVGIIGNVVAGRMLDQGFDQIWKNYLNGKTLTFGFLLAIVAFIVLPQLPPNRVKDVRWCQDGEVQITGKLADKYNGSLESEETLQIQIFTAGSTPSDTPVETPVFVTTDMNGFFSIRIPQTSSAWSASSQLYVVNIVYWYDNIFGEQWKGKDVKKGAPPKCSS